jgi:hypothetical protein
MPARHAGIIINSPDTETECACGRSAHGTEPAAGAKGMQGVLALLLLVAVSVSAACSGTTQTPTPTAGVARPVPTGSPAAATSASVVVSPAAAASVAPPSPSPATATALPAPSTPSPTAATPATLTPTSAVQAVWVANTDGGGVYLRNSPHDGDRGRVLPEGTRLTVTGSEVEGDGQRWYPVQTIDDNVDGYVQVIYTATTEPQPQPAAPRSEPR